MSSTSKMHYQVLERGAGTTKILSKESLIFLIYQLKMVRSLWQVAKVNYLKRLQKFLVPDIFTVKS